MDKVNDLAQFYKVLGDETRLRLIQLLAGQEAGSALCVGSLAKALDTSASNVSQHLKVLKGLGLVIANRRGYKLHYFLNSEQFNDYDCLRADIFGETFTKSINPIQTEENNMCCKQDKDCSHPEHKQNPKDCTPEQIEECHGEGAKHHCCEDQEAS